MVDFYTEYQSVLTTLFSGAGVAVIGFIIRFVYIRNKGIKSKSIIQTVKTGNGSTVYQAGESITVTLPKSKNNDDE